MATKEQVEFIMNEFPKAHPVNFFRIINDANAGIGFAMKLLYAAEGNRLSAGAISDAMGVSTARVAVLLKKMENKGLIVRESDEADARVTIVRLSEKGIDTARAMREKILDHISGVIDKLGMEKLEQFIALSVEVKEAMEERLPPEAKTL
ncbi:MAG: MarR family transcriptional regulator [Oscillospiraceae bacterium]|nr:MarR family transcriptional regulator [Oscillospiraceae bacterium]